MKYLILDYKEKRIMFILDELVIRESDGYYLVNGGKLAIPSGEFSEVVEVDTIPEGVVPEKYCYIDGEFVPNPNYVEPTEPDALDLDEFFDIVDGRIE